MAAGGRILHHLKYYAADERNALIYTGFQAGGTRGAAIVDGAAAVKIHGAYAKIRAKVHNLHMLSAHADDVYARGLPYPPGGRLLRAFAHSR